MITILMNQGNFWLRTRWAIAHPPLVFAHLASSKCPPSFTHDIDIQIVDNTVEMANECFHFLVANLALQKVETREDLAKKFSIVSNYV